MNQLIDRVIKTSLIMMILLSLFLSWKIWTKPANRSVSEKENNSELVQMKKMSEVYVPTKLFYHKSKNEFLTSSKENTLLDIHNKLIKFEMKNSKIVDEKSIKDRLFSENTFNLLYPNELPLSVYKDIYRLELEVPKDFEDFRFNRLIYSFEKEEIYFVNSKLTTGIKFSTKGDSNSIKELVKNEKKNNYSPVKLSEENIAGIYYLTDDVKLKTFSYMVATQSFTTFSKAFFEQSNDLYSNDTENVNLSNGEGESLTIQSETGEVNYVGKLNSTSAGTNKLYQDTFQYVENLGNALGTLRYFDDKEGNITYRNYVDGFPVFGNDIKGRLEIMVQNRRVLVRTNQEAIQIPIPSDETVTLLSTDKMLNNLVENGVDISLIEDAQIGYEWQTNQETKQAVDLVPTWYVKYKNIWYSDDKLIKDIEKGGAD
ncbi:MULTISPECIES: two-component system activity regulator YycH [Vagococcus]|nr:MULTISPECIES: two-component system activity regulator YycH [Vagococcus]HCM90374.1 hypothetical protein [Vagococcus sp.]